MRFDLQIILLNRSWKPAFCKSLKVKEKNAFPIKIFFLQKVEQVSGDDYTNEFRTFTNLLRLIQLIYDKWLFESSFVTSLLPYH